MSWASLTNDQAVSFDNLQDAINNGYFTAITPLPSDTRCIKCSEIDSVVYAEPVSGGDLLVTKSQIIATSSSYFPIYDCYWLTSDDDIAFQACWNYGSQTLFNTTGTDQWFIGDVVYEYYGGQYLPLSRDYDINTGVSFTVSGGYRAWVILEGYSGIVIDNGFCQ